MKVPVYGFQAYALLILHFAVGKCAIAAIAVISLDHCMQQVSRNKADAVQSPTSLSLKNVKIFILVPSFCCASRSNCITVANTLNLRLLYFVVFLLHFSNAKSGLMRASQYGKILRACGQHAHKYVHQNSHAEPEVGLQAAECCDSCQNKPALIQMIALEFPGAQLRQ